MSPFRLSRPLPAANDDRAPTLLRILADVSAAMRSAGLSIQRTRDHGPAWFPIRAAYGLRLAGIEDGGVPVFAAVRRSGTECWHPDHGRLDLGRLTLPDALAMLAEINRPRLRILEGGALQRCQENACRA